MPDITAAGHGAVFLIIVGDFNAVQDPFSRRDLIRPHDHQHVLGSENAVLGQDIQDRMPGKEGPGEVNQIRNHTVIGICPEAGELKTVAGLFLLLLAGLSVFYSIEPSTVGIILGVCAITDHKDLDILKQTASSPERISLVTVDLVESLPDGHAAPFQLHMDHWESIDQDRYIITVAVPCSFILTDSVLIDDLKKIIMDVLLVDQGDVLGGAIITLQDLDKVLLDLPSLLNDMIIWIRQGVFKEPVPFGIGEGVAVQDLQLLPEIRDQLCLRMNRKVFIALFGEHTNEFPLQFSFALIAVGPGLYRLIFRDNGVLRCLGNDIKIRHLHHLNSYNLSSDVRKTSGTSSQFGTICLMIIKHSLKSSPGKKNSLCFLVLSEY